eukprot:scaffold39901_cov229-Amphora_coffeaeformis.AAC.2
MAPTFTNHCKLAGNLLLPKAASRKKDPQLLPQHQDGIKAHSPQEEQHHWQPPGCNRNHSTVMLKQDHVNDPLSCLLQNESPWILTTKRL